MSTYEHIDNDPLPVRPRRKLVTPLSAGLVTVLVAAGGFIAGVEVQKGQESSSSGSAAAANGLPAFAQGARAGGGGFPSGGFPGQRTGGAAPTTGTVANKHGKLLYVTTSSGNTVRVRTTASSKLSRTSGASIKGIYPGDTVVITGSTAKDGTVTATRVTATAKNAPSGGGFGGFAPGGAPPTGSSGQ